MYSIDMCVLVCYIWVCMHMCSTDCVYIGMDVWRCMYAYGYVHIDGFTGVCMGVCGEWVYVHSINMCVLVCCVCICMFLCV